MKILSNATIRSILSSAILVLLTACGSFELNRGSVDSPFSTVDVTAPISDVGQMVLLRAQDGRFKVASQDRDLLFNLDPDVTFARFGSPYKQGSTLLLPVYITTPHCQNRVVAFLIERAKVQSFQYLGGNCATPVVETVWATWMAHQKVSDTHINHWSFDGEKIQLQRKLVAGTAPKRYVPRALPATMNENSEIPTADIRQTPVSTSSHDEPRKLHINLMD